jgi:uncharacterized membrane protein YfcA
MKMKYLSLLAFFLLQGYAFKTECFIGIDEQNLDRSMTIVSNHLETVVKRCLIDSAPKFGLIGAGLGLTIIGGMIAYQSVKVPSFNNSINSNNSQVTFPNTNNVTISPYQFNKLDWYKFIFGGVFSCLSVPLGIYLICNANKIIN